MIINTFKACISPEYMYPNIPHTPELPIVPPSQCVAALDNVDNTTGGHVVLGPDTLASCPVPSEGEDCLHVGHGGVVCLKYGSKNNL